MNIIFLGTPDFAVRPLEAVLEAGHRVLAVITQSDKPRGRGKEMRFPPVKEYALKRGLEVLQFDKIRFETDMIRALTPDIMITAAYGQIIPQEIIDIPPHGIINAHASVLPAYRGAMPVNWALINGETRTGITIMQTDAGIDSGDIILTRSIEILPDENAGELLNRLSVLGAECLISALAAIESGQAVRTKQDNADASYFPILKKDDGNIVWAKSAVQIANLVRGVTPAPGAYTFYKGQKLKILRAAVVSNETLDAESGKIIISEPKKGLFVACGGGTLLEITELQAENSKPLAARTFLNGKKLDVGEVLGNG